MRTSSCLGTSPRTARSTRAPATRENIGTTQRGIGPCYRDKVGRSHAIRFGDLYRPDFREKVEHRVEAKNAMLAVLDPGHEPLDASAIYEQYSAFAERLELHVCDTTDMLLDAAEAGKRILFEGAPGRAARCPTTAPFRL